MRPWKIVLSAVIGAICAVAAILWPDLSVVPTDGLVGLLLPRLPTLALTAGAVYALVAVLASAGGLIATAVDQRRRLGRIDAVRQAAATLDWIAAFDTTALRALMPRPVGALPKSSGGSATILLSHRFDRREARAEAARVFYIWLARTHAFAALAGLAALAALGFAQQQGDAPFLPGKIPTASTVLVLAGLLMLIVLARYAIDVALEPLIDAMSRLPWEQADAGRLRYAVELLETVGVEAGTGGRSIAELPNEVPERLAVALEEGNRVLSAIGERLSMAAERLGAATRSASDALDRMLRETRSIVRKGGDAGGAGVAALQGAVEALTAELREVAGPGRGGGALEEDRRALVEAAERLSAAADAVGAAARSSSDALAAALRETRSIGADGGDGGGARVGTLQAAVEALTAELRQGAAAGRSVGAFEEDRRALAGAAERLSTAADAVGAAARSSSDALAAALRETRSIAGDGRDAGDAGVAGLQAAVEALTAELRQGAAVGRGGGAPEEDRRALAEAAERLSTAADAVGAATRSSSDALAAALRETAAHTATEPGASSEALRAGVEALTAEVRQLTALFGAARKAPPAVKAAPGGAATDLGRELQKLLAEI
jgi:hypothetical protein